MPRDQRRHLEPCIRAENTDLQDGCFDEVHTNTNTTPAGSVVRPSGSLSGTDEWTALPYHSILWPFSGRTDFLALNPSMQFLTPATAIALIASALGGCAGIPPAPSAGGPTSTSNLGTEETALSHAYRQLNEKEAVGPDAGLGFSDGFGRNGAQVTRRYFSASGKDCTVILDSESSDSRTLCRDSRGIVNLVGSPGGSSGR